MTGKIIRITVVGDGDTGKTCMLIVYKDKEYNTSYIPTVFDVYSMTIPINYVEYTVILSDTAGQEEFDKLRRLAYRETDVFVLCYAVNQVSSFENVSEKWNPELRKCCPRSKIILAATKCDLRETNSPTIKTVDGERLAELIQSDGFMETSAKNNYNVSELFGLALQMVVTSRKIKKRKSGQCSLL